MQEGKNYDVIIAGAGPVGLFLSCELALAGLKVLVLERLADPQTPLKGPGMGSRGLNLPSAQVLHRRGLLDAVRKTAILWFDPAADRVSPPPKNRPRFSGHFAGILLDASNVDFSPEKYVLPGPSTHGGMVTLDGVEEAFTQRARQLGVEIRLGAAVTGLTQDEEGVTVELGNEQIRASWLVGCDGGRSTVRKAAGFDFPGTGPEVTGTMAIVDSPDLDKLPSGWNLTPHGLFVNGPMPNRVSIAEFDGGATDRETPVTRDAPVTIAELQARIQRVTGISITINSIKIATRWTDNTRQASTYRRGRVLLAGDAAHVHSPFGGQGMNLGIGDAMNLGWKLAATIQGWAPPDLLDTYTTERHPIGAWALNWTRAQIAIMRPDPYAQAIQPIIRDLINTKDGATYFARQIAGVWLRYNLPGDHPLIGHSAPDFEFTDGTYLGAHLRDGKSLLLNMYPDFCNNEALRKLVAPYANRLNYLSSTPKETLGIIALLIRPDGFVTWATSDTNPNLDQLSTTITRWLGPPNIE